MEDISEKGVAGAGRCSWEWEVGDEDAQSLENKNELWVSLKCVCGHEMWQLVKEEESVYKKMQFSYGMDGWMEWTNQAEPDLNSDSAVTMWPQANYLVTGTVHIGWI